MHKFQDLIYQAHHIGNNAPVQLLDFIETLEKSIGIEAKKNFMDIQAGDVVSTYADTNDLIISQILS